jgi:hypothetical protein
VLGLIAEYVTMKKMEWNMGHFHSVWRLDQPTIPNIGMKITYLSFVSSVVFVHIFKIEANCAFLAFLNIIFPLQYCQE